MTITEIKKSCKQINNKNEHLWQIFDDFWIFQYVVKTPFS